MFYLVIFIVLCVLSVLSIQFRDRTSQQLLMWLSGIMLVLVAGLRYETGGDWDTYTAIFESAPSLDLLGRKPWILVTSTIEGGFILLCSVIRSLGGGIQWLFFLVTLLNISLIAGVLPKYTKLPVVSMMAYFAILYFTLEMIYIRQATAVALCFVALQYIKERRIVKYMLLVVLACCFHRVAILMIPLYFLLDKQLPRWVYIVVVAVGCVIMWIGVPWFRTIFFAIGQLLGGAFESKIMDYLESGKFAVARTISTGFYVNILLFGCVMLFKDRLEASKHGTVHLNMFVLSLLLYYYCYELIEVSNRARLFFLISVIVVLADLIDTMGSSLSRLIAFVPTAIYCFTFASNIMLENPSSAAYNPYQNYLIYQWTDQYSTGKHRLDQSKRSFNKERKQKRH